MVNLFGGLFFLSVFALIIGLAKPSFLKLASRKLALFIFGSAAFVSLMGIGITNRNVSPVSTTSSSTSVLIGTSSPVALSDVTQSPTTDIPVAVSQTPQATPTPHTVSISQSTNAYGTQTQTTHCVANQSLPDSTCTPGAILTTDPSVFCVSGYTQTVRNVSDSVRRQVFAEYGIDYSLHGNYEVDHLISLELGGSNDISNLWPEPYYVTDGARTKDKLENYLHSQVCSGAMAAQEAQREISSDWVKYFQQDGLTPAPSETSGTTQTQTAVAATSTQSTGGYYTSSYSSAKYYYPANCSAWESLSTSYLKHFDTLDQLLAAYSRTLSPQCP